MKLITQGSNAGRRYPNETITYPDSRTGVEVTRLTSSRAHDHHLYFTAESWFDDDQQLLFASDRDGSPNLYSIDLISHSITQLTDLPFIEEIPLRGCGFPFQLASTHEANDEVYFWWNGELCALSLSTYSIRSLYALPDGYRGDVTDVSADGKYVCTSIYEDTTAAIPPELGTTPFRRAGPGFRTVWESAPHSKLLAIPINQGEPVVCHEMKGWIAHVNTSPTRPDLLTFAHYGPWTEVDHRAWCCNLDTGEIWKVRARAPDGTPSPPTVHEYWFADGVRIGYYGLNGNGESIYGIVNYDDTNQREWSVHHQPPSQAPHFHSRDGLLVGDGNQSYPFLTIWDLTDDFAGPRDLAYHGTSRDVQVTHAHPRLSMADDNVVFTSDRSGYANVYLAAIPQFSDLNESGIAIS